MGSLRAKLIDRNRYAKRYPMFKAPTRNSYLGDSDLAIEVGSVYFNDAEIGTLTFDAQFIDTEYQVVAIARNSGTENANVNVFISSKTTTGVTIQASSNFTGYVDVFVVRIG